jgi:hypothetical protein
VLPISKTSIVNNFDFRAINITPVRKMKGNWFLAHRW